jgi:shikimate 5-dehydrogenase
VAPGYEPLKATLLAMAEHAMLDFAGCSVTIPHKENLVQLAQECIELGDLRWSLDDLSRACGSANTLAISRDNRGRIEKLEVKNTDGPAAAGALRDALGTLVGNTVLVVGAGGTARALAATIVLEGGRALVVNRTPERAEKLCAELRESLRCDTEHLRAVRHDELESLAPSLSAVFNCTSAGMAGGGSENDSPLSAEVISALSTHCIVAESVYRPLHTPLLTAAIARGLQVVTGTQLFVGQAAEQSQLWTDLPAPRAMLLQVAREALALDAEAN